ncbi:diguanylate cyclase [Fundidesulfovibrio butyratiphilus]
MPRRAATPQSDSFLSRAENALRNPPEPDALLEELRLLAEAYKTLRHKLYKTLAISDAYQAESKELSLKLEESAARFEQLRAMTLPICVRCRKVRVDDDYWQRLESYMANNLDVMFSSGLCPECVDATRRELGQAAPGAPSPRPAAAPARGKRHAPAPDDPKVAQALALAASAGELNPALGREVGQLAQNYAKLSRRFNKILTISDSYQSQLRDLNSRLELMARTDLLTGLPNRWEMNNRLEIERSRAERHNAPFSLVLGDMDHFKLINDTFGHQAGDTVLRRVSQALSQALRSEDVCARWGGEEFLMLLPETRLDQAVIVAEKLRAVVGKLAFAWDGVAVKATISFGVAQYFPGSGVDECLKRADDALYQAKGRGRDQVARDETPNG